MSNLYEASNQWASRPADERFWGLKDLGEFLLSEKNQSEPVNCSVKDFRATNDNGQLAMTIPGIDAPVQMTNWSFGQVASYAKAPEGYLQRLPAELAAQNLNYGLQNRDDDTAQVLLRRNGTNFIRSLTSTEYERVYNYDLIKAIEPALEMGWMVPPARPVTTDPRYIDPRARLATEQDIVPNQDNFGLAVKVGDMIAPAGAYAGDRDMFIFLVNPERVIDDGVKGLMRGVFITNSEVGNKSLKVSTFYLENVCGNHICHHTTGLKNIRFIHRGHKIVEFQDSKQLTEQLTQYAELSTEGELNMIKAARLKQIASTREEVIETLYGKRYDTSITKKVLNGIYDTAELYQDTAKAAPTTVWGFTHGMTRFSQTIPYANKRQELDMVAGRILQLAA